MLENLLDRAVQLADYYGVTLDYLLSLIHI
mgnify:CR=1 FL=1